MDETGKDTVDRNDISFQVGRCIRGFNGGSVHEGRDRKGNYLLIVNQVDRCDGIDEEERSGDDSMLIYRFKSKDERDRFVSERWG